MKEKIIFLALIVMAFGIISCDDDDETVTPISQVYVAELDGLNGTTMDGTVTLSVVENTLQVDVVAEGLEPNQMHPQHIHGLDDASMNAVCPPASADDNGDNLIDLDEGAPFYGPIQLALEDFPTANAQGEINYSMEFELGEGDTPTWEELQPIENRLVVIHGMTVDGTYMATLPVACGQLIDNEI